MTNFYSRKELIEFGFKSVGKNVKVSKKSSLYSISGSIGNDTRIDDFVLLKGHLVIGNKVHICSHSSLSGVGGKITIEDLCGIGVSNIFYTSSDDMLQSALCGPLVPKKFTKTKNGNIFVSKGAALGGRVTVMPHSHIGKFTAIGLGAIITGILDDFSLYMQINGKLKKLAKRNSSLLNEYAKISLMDDI